MKYWRWFCFILFLGLLPCVPFTWAVDSSSNAVTDAWIPWGDSTCVSNEDVLFSPWPVWMVSAFKIGGTWDTNSPAWVVEVGDTNESSLNIDVDRSLLTNNALMRLDYVDHSNAILMLDLYEFTGTNDPNEPVFTSNLFNNLISGGGGVTSRTFTIPFSLYTNVVGIRLRRDAGAMTVFDTLLSSDRDGDGYADSEELAWGSDPDSMLSVPCAAITGQVFYAGVQSGVIHVLAATNANDWASAYYLTMSLPPASHVAPFTLPGLPLRRPYYARAWRDVNDNQTKDYWEPFGTAVPVSLYLGSNTGNVVIVMSDPDSDGDGMSDADELMLGMDPLTSNTYARLPFIEGFETNTVHVGDINNQNHWLATPLGAACVQTNTVYEGVQAMLIKSGDTQANVSQLFAVSNAPVVWLDARVQALSCSVPTNAATGSAVMFIDGNGFLKAYDGLNVSSNKWVTLTNVPSCETTGAWVRLTTKLDYSAQRWLVCVNGVLAGEGLGFATPVSQFTMVSFVGGQSGVDSLSISTNKPTGLSLDGDRLPDDWELAQFGNLDQTDTGDADSDGVNNQTEFLRGTSPVNPDTDNDGIPDGWELAHGLNPTNAADAALDADGDGLSNVGEYAAGTDPRNAASHCWSITGKVAYTGPQTGLIWVAACSSPTGFPVAGQVINVGTGVYVIADLPPNSNYWVRAWRDTDGNGSNDFWEAQGVFTNNPVVLHTNVSGINITLSDPDSDGDGMPDWWELAHGFNPTNALDALQDTDGDGLNNLAEYQHKTDPRFGDSDHDGIDDGPEVGMASDPRVANTCTQLPFIEGFETNTVMLGELNGQNHWSATPLGASLVQTNKVYEGVQAMLIKSDDTPANVCQLFAVSNAPVVWLDVHVQALERSIPTNAATGSAIMFFDANGYLKVYDGLNVSSNKWVTLTNVPSCGTTGSWVRLTTKLDYSTQRWLVCVDGILAAEGLGFAMPVSQFTMVSFVGGASGVDAFAVSTNEPAGLSLDGDYLVDEWEIEIFGNLDQTDAGDPDHDGASNLEEYLYGTDVNSPDTDGDGLPDGWEIHNGFDPKHAGEAALDPDGDGLTNLQEYQLGTNPKSPDTDGDGMPDKWEVDHQLNPLVNDATQDADADGLSNLLEFQNGADPHNLDSDGDGLWDGAEVNTYGTSPVSTDSDGDGFLDVWEVLNGTRPDVADADADTDGDGLSNMEEYLRGTPPASATNALKRLTWSGVSAGSWTDASWLNAPPAYPGATEDACLVSNVMLSIDGSQKVNILQVTKGEVRVGGMLAPYSVVLSNGVLSSAGAGSFDSPNTNRTAGRFAFEMVAGTNSAVLKGAGASLRKSGSGSVLMTGLNGYSGRTQLDAGVLLAQDGAGLPQGSQLYFNGGILGTTGLFARTIGASTGLVYWASNGGFAALGGPLSVRLNDGAPIEWSSTNGFNGKTLYLGSVLANNVTELQNSILLKGSYTVQVDDNTLSTQDVARLSGAIANGDATPRGLAKGGTGILELAGTNTFSGTFTLSGGLLRGLDGVNIPSNSLLAINGGQLESCGIITRPVSTNSTSGGVYWANTGGFAARGGKLTLDLGAGQTLNWSNLVNGFNAKTLVFGSTTADEVVELTNPVELRGDRTVQVNDNPATTADLFRMSGPIANGDATPCKLTKTGTGVLQLSGTNSYSGSTILSAGILRAIDGQGLPPASLLQLNGGVLESVGTFSRAITNTAVGVYWSGNGGFAANGGALSVSLNGGAPIHFGSTNDGFSGKTLFLGSTTADSLVKLTNPLMLFANRIIQVDDNPFASTDFAQVSGVIGNGDATARALSKYGKGLLELTASNTFTGGAAVNAGTLRIAGSIASLATVYSNATLAGSGMVKGFNLVNGAILAPGGDQVGTLQSYATVTFGSNSVYQWRMGVTNHDMMVVKGNVTLSRCRLQLREFGGCTEPESHLTFLRYTGTVSSITNFVVDTSLVAGLTNWDTSAATVVHDAVGKRFYLTGLRVTPLHDSDGDGMDDLWESLNGLDPADPFDAQGDADGDGLTNFQEFHLRLVPGCADSDNDGLTDVWEVASGTDPSEYDSQFDQDDDGLITLLEYQLGTWPLIADSDGDGLNDGEEALLYKTDPVNADTDGDETLDLVDLVTLNGVDTTSRTGEWATNGTSIVSLSSTNARMEYGVDVPQADLYRLVVELDNYGSTRTTTMVFRLQILVDNLPCGWLRALTPSNQITRASFALPWLTQGQHTLRLAWLDDKSTNKVLEVHQVILQQVDGPDVDQNGRQDGADTLLATGIDTDSDGLSNKDELDIYGTDPLKWDTDGDTLGDGEEWLLFNTNPLMSSSGTNGIPDAVLVAEKNGVETAAREIFHITCPWGEQGSVLVNVGQDADASYDFGVNHSAIYRMGLQLRNINADLPDNYRFKVMLSVDGVSNSVAEILADMDRSGTGYVQTAWLTPGVHRMTIKWLNDASAPGRAATIGIEKISLYTVNGVDADTNGVQDWMEALLVGAGDSDHDGISDKDEITLYHSNPLKMDSDDDGVDDLAEIRLGLDPNSSDSDHDGVGDGVEMFQSLTDPATGDFDGTVTVFQSLNGNQTQTRIGSWTSEGAILYARERSGALDYPLSIPTAGHYAVIMELTQQNELTSQDSFDLACSIDGVSSGRQMVRAPFGVVNEAVFFLPYLEAGNHTVRFRWFNTEANTFLQVNAVRLVSFGGPDTDANGRSDWLDHRLARISGNEAAAESSVVSPLCLEGTSVYQDKVSIISSFITEGQTNPVVVQHGIGDDWYANVQLSPTDRTDIVVWDQGSMTGWTNSVAWEAVNVIEHPYTNGLSIRSGSSLRLAGWPVGATNGEVVYTVLDAGTNVVTNLVVQMLEPLPCAFGQAGRFNVHAVYSNADFTASGSLEVCVVSGTFNGREAACVIGQPRVWDCPGISTDAVVVADSQLVVASIPTNGGTRFTLQNPLDKSLYMVARLGADGPVLDSAMISGIYADHGYYYHVVDSYADGSRLIEVRLQLGHIPQDLSVALHIFVGGVVFEDGTLDKILGPADFDELGVCSYRLLQSASSFSSVCHTTLFYQGGIRL